MPLDDGQLSPIIWGTTGSLLWFVNTGSGMSPREPISRSLSPSCFFTQHQSMLQFCTKHGGKQKSHYAPHDPDNAQQTRYHGEALAQC